MRACSREDAVELTPATNAYYFQTLAESTVFPVSRKHLLAVAAAAAAAAHRCLCTGVRLDGVSHNNIASLQSAAPQFQLTQVIDKFRFFQFDSEW